VTTYHGRGVQCRGEGHGCEHREVGARVGLPPAEQQTERRGVTPTATRMLQPLTSTCER
jgi:hypothetical protein